MIYDCVPFFNELDILKLRMQIMAPYVDFFVIEEASVTFSGEPKRMIFAENRQLFAEFEEKIRYVAVDNSPLEGVTTHERDKFQKNQLICGLSGCKPEDIIIFSDVDEIPNPETLKKLLPEVEDGKIYMLAQRLFYCYLDMEEVSGKLLSVTGEFEGVEKPMWLGTKICRYHMLDKYTTEELRNKEQKEVGVRVPDGGWHFSYMGGGRNQSVEDRVKYKIKSAAHQEYNNRSTLSKVRKNIKNHQDIFGRDAQMVQVKIDETFPKYLRENIDKYQYLLYRKPKWYEFWK